MKSYPHVIDEFQTLKLIGQGYSIARFGDGEWRCAQGGGCTSQGADTRLAGELRQVLHETGERFLVGIPKVDGCPRAESWAKYCAPPYLNLLSAERPYYSSFITRPDNAPTIDTPEYWASVRDLWLGKDVILVVGAAKDGKGEEKKSLTTEMLHDASSVRVIIAPRQHAYESIDAIEHRIVAACAVREPDAVLLCIGATATVLAWRLWKCGFHAIDMGHIGMFMRHAGAYRYTIDDLASPYYRAQLAKLHSTQRWGDDGHSHKPEVEAIAAEFDVATILDYGCGRGTLAEAMAPARRVSGFDPGIPGKDKMPKPCELVVCTDVLEHIEPEKLDAVLDHIFRITGKVAYLVIALRAANAVLPDGRNAHLSVHEPDWWLEQIKGVGFRVQSYELKKTLRVRAVKP